MKKLSVMCVILSLILLMSACSQSAKPESTPGAAQSSTQEVITEDKEAKASEEKQREEMKISIEINGYSFTATLENNESARELYTIIKDDGLSVFMSDYSGFEKVGALGVNLSSSDVQTTTKPGDIVLYQSNQIVMFYGSNSWSYTRLGKIDDLSSWEEALGSGDITAEFSVL